MIFNPKWTNISSHSWDSTFQGMKCWFIFFQSFPGLHIIFQEKHLIFPRRFVPGLHLLHLAASSPLLLRRAAPRSPPGGHHWDGGVEDDWNFLGLGPPDLAGLVNVHKTIWLKIQHAINGKTHYFDWAIFNSYVTNYQRVSIFKWYFNHRKMDEKPLNTMYLSMK